MYRIAGVCVCAITVCVACAAQILFSGRCGGGGGFALCIEATISRHNTSSNISYDHAASSHISHFACGPIVYKVFETEINTYIYISAAEVLGTFFSFQATAVAVDALEVADAVWPATSANAGLTLATARPPELCNSLCWRYPLYSPLASTLASSCCC